jgi:hypothetical protein
MINLGIIYNENGKIVNHRSLIKVFVNPFLRLIGFQIATVYDIKENKLLYKIKLIKCSRKQSINFNYELEKEWSVKRKRMFI